MTDCKTAYEMFERSSRFFRDNPAIIFENAPERAYEQPWTYGYLNTQTNFLARGLAYYGVARGDKVCLCLHNAPKLIAAYLAVSKLGAASVMLNPALPGGNIKKIAQESDYKFWVDEKTIRDVYLSSGRYANRPDLTSPLGAEDTAAILYSSGTTGEQKGVELSVKNIYRNVSYTSVLTGMTPKDRLMCFVPLTHCFGLNFVMTACLYTGAALVLHEKFGPKQILDSSVNNKVSMFFAVPAVYNLFLKQEADPFFFSSVRYFFYAADSLSVESALKWEKEYGRKIYSGYGLTETSPFATSNHPDIYKLGSVGKPIPGVNIKIASDGEIFIRGHNVMKGYFKNPVETAKSINSEGWFATGDIGYIDHEGYLFLKDRKKDMINMAGEKVWPAEVEKKIILHPAVMEAAVVGIPHEIMGEVPKAFIVLKEKNSATKEILQEFLKPLLTKNEFPRQIEFLDRLPRNPSGKILKNELRQKKETPPLANT
ncbi:AMP-binding protein [Candidatus Giovannonibacteria bacterium]|nr:AMP-binding protein [Candidatus Giovannonibacteria bacterium]